MKFDQGVEKKKKRNDASYLLMKLKANKRIEILR